MTTHRQYEPESYQPVQLTEVVQGPFGTETIVRETLLDPLKANKGRFVLPGVTVMEKLSHLKAIVSASPLIHQLELLDYIEDMETAPLLLDTVEVTEVD